MTSPRLGLFADEFARFAILARRDVSPNTAMLRVGLEMLRDRISGVLSWGEDFVPAGRFPSSYCVFVGRDGGQGHTGPPVAKPYTPLETGGEHIDLLVKRYPAGRVSEPLFQAQPGDHVLMRGPRQKLSLPFAQSPTRLVILAAGTGITPMWQVLTHLVRASTVPRDIVLLYANRSAGDVLLASELDELARRFRARNSTFTLQHILEDRDGLVTLAHIPPATETDLALVCGPTGFNALLCGGGGERENDCATSLLAMRNYGPQQVYKF